MSFSKFAEQKDATGFQNAFDALLSSKIQDKLEALKADVAAKIFGTDRPVTEAVLAKDKDETGKNDDKKVDPKKVTPKGEIKKDGAGGGAG